MSQFDTSNGSGALAATWKVVRFMQSISLITIIGMTANFIAEMVAANQSPPKVLIGTLSVTCLAVLYCALTTILFFEAYLHLLLSAALDSLLLIAVIVVAVTVGKPLSYLDCTILPSSGTTSSFLDSVGINMEKVNYWVWAGASRTTCFEMKAIWGLSIALCVLFAFSGACAVVMWKKELDMGKAAEGKEIDLEG